jgi:regulator of sigma E protease
MFILNILLFIVVLGVIILIHEAGHFYFAKRAGILCHEFSIGMGPALYQKRKGETVYSIRGIPIGGYVSMAGEAISDALIKEEQTIGLKINEQGLVYQIILTDKVSADIYGQVVAFDLYGKDFDPLFIELKVDEEVKKYTVLRDANYKLDEKREMWITPSEKSFESKTLWQRFLVIFAGPMMNFILAFLLFLIVGFFVQKPITDSNMINEVTNNYAADVAGMKSGDLLLTIDGNPINAWTDIPTVFANLDDALIDITYERDGEVIVANDIAVSVAVQMAGLVNTYVDEDTEEVTIYNSQPIIGQAYGRAQSDGGLKQGDVIEQITVNNTTYDVTDWNDIVAVFRNYSNGDVTIVYQRDGITETASYELISESALNKLGTEGILFQLGITATSEFDWGYTLSYAPKKVVSDMGEVFTTLGLLFDRSENLGIGDLSGPVGIYSLVSSTAKQGVLSIIAFTGFLSINIGLLNLLPIPALDGGRLVFLGIEAVTKKPLPRKLENSINNVMFILLLTMFVFVTYKDILRLIANF